MPKQKKYPGYRRQKRGDKSALAFVEVGGVRRYLGTYGTPASYQQYEALKAELDVTGRLPPKDVGDLCVVELADRYWAYAQEYYRRPDGTHTSELVLIKQAIGLLVSLHGDLPVTNFDPVKLASLRKRMVAPAGEGKNWCRDTANGMFSRIKRVFKWGTELGYVPAAVVAGLQAVRGVPKGRGQARETGPVKPVPPHVLDATLPHLSKQVSAMVRLQLLCGARPGEVCTMRACDIDVSGKVWQYRPAAHKTQHHEHKRVIPIGPRGQEILKEFLSLDTQAYLFNPAEAEADRLAAKHELRTTPLHQGNSPGTNRKEAPLRKPGNRYDVNSYRRAIARACDVAFPPPEHLAQAEGETREEWMNRLSEERKAEPRAWRKAHRWHPHRLRHNFATTLRAQFGIDVAQTILGHRLGSAITEIYAEPNTQKAENAILQIG